MYNEFIVADRLFLRPQRVSETQTGTFTLSGLVFLTCRNGLELAPTGAASIERFVLAAAISSESRLFPFYRNH
jgi:hypothetical protein